MLFCEMKNASKMHRKLMKSVNSSYHLNDKNEIIEIEKFASSRDDQFSIGYLN